jgi:UrcA family protein
MTRTPALAALLMCFVFTTPAAAEEQVWQNGDGFSIRSTGLDLTRFDDRERLLRRVDSASARLCRGVSPRTDRILCAKEAQERAIAGAPAMLRPQLRAALTAREETRLASR